MLSNRDLKLENFLLIYPDNDTEVKVCDFGFANEVPTDTQQLTTQLGSAGRNAVFVSVQLTMICLMYVVRVCMRLCAYLVSYLVFLSYMH
jgi:serine/threonine protein kinase